MLKFLTNSTNKSFFSLPNPGEYAHNPNRDFSMNLNNHHNPIYSSKNDLSNDVMMHQNTVNDLMRSGAKLGE